MKFLLTLLFTCLAFALTAFTVAPEDAVILLPTQPDSIKRFAAEELAYHLKRITGRNIPILSEKSLSPGKYPFYVGTAPANGKQPLVREEARVLITPQATYLYGEDFPSGDILRRHTRCGTLFAVYELLEKAFNVRWIEPGEEGVVFTASSVLKLAPGSFSWHPGRLIQREIRPGYEYTYANYMRVYGSNVPASFQLSEQDFDRRRREVMLFFRRHRMGNSEVFGYGHAFTDYWKKYGEEHPEYFALFNGKRAPVRPKQPGTVKMCVSSPAFHAQILKNWGGKSNFINVCENDWGDYCQCPACLKLDAPRPGEAFDAHLSDRYLHFANTIQQQAAKMKPNVSVVTYAYSCYRFPPRREKVDPRLIIGFVPSMLELEQVGAMYDAWQKAGAKKIFLRPNDQHINTGLPMGFEKQLFDHFQLGVKYGIIGTDYDCCHNFWPATGIADYILSRAHIDPAQSFEHWEKEYCSSYGAAADDVRDYFRYFRTNIWEKRLLPNREEILRVGRYGNFRRGVMWEIKKYYNEQDFDATDAILARAATKKLAAAERARLGKLQLANEHARLTFHALVASNKFAPARKLLEFREKHRDNLLFDWGMLMGIEKQFGDVTGIENAVNFRRYRCVHPAPYRWYFRPDPENVGQQQKWESNRLGSKTKLAQLRTDRAWERQIAKEIGVDLHKQLTNYNGIGYYMQDLTIPPAWKGSQIELYFGGVDESAQVYVNGHLAGERLARRSDDYQKSFSIPVTQWIDWSRPTQNVVVRVEDKAGLGGIWKTVFLVSLQP